MLMNSKPNPKYKHSAKYLNKTKKHVKSIDISDTWNILKFSEKTLDAIWQLMEKYNLPEIEVKLKCKRK